MERHIADHDNHSLVVPDNLAAALAADGVMYDEEGRAWLLDKGGGRFEPATPVTVRTALVVHLARSITAVRAAGADAPSDGPVAEWWSGALRAPLVLCREALDLVAMGDAR